jgi:hypothetical protein
LQASFAGALQANQSTNGPLSVLLQRVDHEESSIPDPYASRHIQCLIKQYNEFAIADNIRSTKFNYGAKSISIEISFG